MQRYFVKPHQLLDNRITITGDDVHHIVKVMRGKPGDQLIVCDSEGRCARARLVDLGTQEVQAEIVEMLDEQRELPIHVTIAQGLPKSDKLEWIVQKGTELGMTTLVPFSSERTIVKLDPKKEAKKRERWQKIAKEAAEQAHRTRVPEVMPAVGFAELLEQANRYTSCVIAYEQENTTSLQTVLASLRQGDSLCVLIGPEGGFTTEEVAQAEQAGIVPVSLGPRILRTETASQYVLAAVSYHFESPNR
ncbi:16S rRNA (uracil(1498)-N(3))-methyltransferase [Brevibacillus humidisoli]|uniref:16S rRNA (uracil(1498)-N(3))-methyltransferase n=1 Tax=Brevibacillus humidisoli TaxID=2895522 RepID=UPI001E42B7AA|nr:16S rRNA (uracil(1498)-N(3))-methyltransferase [Brevibacillus humidisoli]UFJ43170.1 16S rRNA (uracil(1498)-N(3))-methyltransferase [Brevibacillus humidisoli]